MSGPHAAAPRLLLVLRSPQWMGIARLPRALVRAGFEVASLCPPGSFLGLTRFNQRQFEWPATGNPLYALDAAVRAFQPTLLVPGCDAAVHTLREIVRAQDQGRWPPQAAHLPELVRRSLGPGIGQHDRLSKHANLALAAQLGLRTPVQHLAEDLPQARRAALDLGWPVVLKGEHGSAGSTVRICADDDALACAFHGLQAQAPGLRLAVQAHVQGQGALCAGVAWEGQLLQALAAHKLHTHPGPTSPSSVLRFVEQPALLEALSRLVRALGLSGWCEAEFILPADGGPPCLIELNPRPSPASALGELRGLDLGQALLAHLRGLAPGPAAPLTPHDTVALFPNELARDPHSPHLSLGYHDVPWDDPGLQAALLRGSP